MKTEYTFSVETGQLVYSRAINFGHVYTVNHRDEMGAQHLCSVFVSEGTDAEREFFNHFGDNSSWPEGWYAKVTGTRFTKLSWTAENYPPSKVSWQEYFGVKSP